MKSSEEMVTSALTRPRLTRPVVLADRPRARSRRRADLVDLVGAVLGIAGVWILGAYANSTTRAVTQDVLQFTFIRDLLLLPVTFMEGLVILAAPVAVIGTLLWRRRLRTVVEVLLASGVAAALGWALLAGAPYLPLWVTAPLRVSTGAVAEDGTAATTVAVNLVVVILAALLTTAGEASSMRSVRWSWVGLWTITFLWVLRSSMTLPSAVLSLLLGRAVGSASRWIAGFEDRRASGPELVAALLAVGVRPSRIIRCDLDTTTEPLSTWSISDADSAYLRMRPLDVPDSTYEVPRRHSSGDGNRHYRVWDDLGGTFDVIALDPGREFTGTLRQVWDNLRLRGLSRWVAPSLKAGAERSTLAALSAARAGVSLPEPVGMAWAGESVLLVNQALPPTVPLRDVPAEAVTDEVLDQAWRQLALAHSRAVAHRNLDFDALVLDDTAQVWLINWEQGEAGASDVTRRIDVAQLLVHLTVVVGAGRAIVSARRMFDDEALRSCAPFLQRPVLPGGVAAVLHRDEELEELRAALVAGWVDAAAKSGDAVSSAADSGADASGATELAEGGAPGVGPQVKLADIQRFSPRTVVMVGVLFFAVVGVAGSLNFADIRATLAAADWRWVVAAFALSTLTWLGGAIALLALTAEKLRLRDATLTQVAASLVTLVAPAGIGPAALNMRYLNKQRVPAAVAVATVTLQQVAQLLVTVGLLVVLLLFSGQRLSVSLPYGAIVSGVAALLIGAAVVALIPALRRRVWARISPTWEQIYPRLLWIAGRPRRILAVLAGNLVIIVGFIGTFWACVAAMGQSLNVTTLSLTFLASNSLGSIVPSPGGIGPVEAALTGGLQVAGMPLSLALSVALLYRLVTFYGRAPLGWIAMKVMEKKDLL